MSVSVLRAVLGRAAENRIGSIGILQIQNSHYSTDNENLNLTAWKRGTGGRSSFNGVVATVFGNSGFVGGFLVNRLGKTGSQIILPYRCDHYDTMHLKPMTDLGQTLFTKFDVRDQESVEKAIKYSNVVFNLIGRDYETKNFTYDDVHVKWPRTLARACKKMGVERLIHLSYLNSEEDPEPLVMSEPSRYKKTKWLGEQVLKEEFPDVTILKASEIYGSGDRFLKVLVEPWRKQFDAIPLYRDGDVEKQPVYAADVAQAMINAARDPDSRGQIYQAVGPKRYKLRGIVHWLHQIIRRDQIATYFIYDLKYDPIFKLRVKINEKISTAYPLFDLHMEGLERESTTDKVIPNVPTLEDLGVTLTEMENQVPWEMAVYKSFTYYDTTIGDYEFTKPVPPEPIPIV